MPGCRYLYDQTKKTRQDRGQGWEGAPLAAVVGTDMCTRQEALKGVWAYIKANDLQNPAAKREILPDEKLKAVFGQDKATMYEVMKLISPHILK